MGIMQKLAPQRPILSGIPYSSGAPYTRELPDTPLKVIQLVHTAGTMSGGSSGSYVANTFIKRAYLRVGGKVFLDFNGEVFADAPAWGIKAMREYAQHTARVAGGAEIFEFILPHPLPVGVSKEVVVEFNEIGNINDGDRTTYTGTLGVNVIEALGAFAMPILIQSKYGKYAAGTATSGSFFLDAVQSGKATALIIGTEDNGTFANTTLTNITIQKNGVQLFNGTFAVLQQRTQNKSGVACNTGMAILDLGGLQFGASELKIDFTCAAGTAKDIHWFLIEAHRLNAPKAISKASVRAM